MRFDRIGFIGAGRIARILLGGFQRTGVALPEVAASDIAAEPLEQLKSVWPALRTCPNDNLTPAHADLVILALHPRPLRTVLPTLASTIRPASLFLSLAPSITLKELERLLGTSQVARMIPNAPSLVGKGYNPVAFHDKVPTTRRNALLALFHPLGSCPEVEEKELETYALLSGMGPTYFWFQWETLVQIGTNLGLAPDESRQAVEAMLTGAIELLWNSGLEPAEVMDIIPARPLAKGEEKIRAIFKETLTGLHAKIRPADSQ